MKEILLKSGHTINVDDDDYEKVIQFNWYMQTVPGKTKKLFRWIDKTNQNKGKRQWLHYLIMNSPACLRIEFKDRNPLNCCKENLLIIIKKEKVNKIKKTFEQKKDHARLYRRNRLKNDLQYKIKHMVKVRIYNSLIRQGIKKNNRSTIDMLGCDVATYKSYLEGRFINVMSWDNYGTYWHIDHIKPCSSFNLSDPIQARECFHYTNTQPLEAKLNLSKRDSIDWQRPEYRMAS